MSAAERKTLTRWPTSPLTDTVERWLYMAAPDFQGIPGRFHYDDHGRIVFETEDGLALGAHTFEDGEWFEPCEAPEPDPRDAYVAALEAENAALRAEVSTLRATRLGRAPTVEEVQTHAAPAGDGLGWWLLGLDGLGIVWEVCSLCVEEGVILIDEDPCTAFGRVRDAIPLNASRQPCGVGG